MSKKISCLALGAMLLALSLPAGAQQPVKVPRIGVLTGASPGPSANLEAFRQGLRELGYVEGKNIVVEYRYAEGKSDRLPELVSELLHLKVNVIVVSGTGPTSAAKRATSTIPIVMAQSSDPVGSGVIASLARPGGNVTGLTTIAAELSGKRLELLKEASPSVSRVAVLWDPDSPGPVVAFKETQVVAQTLGVQLQSLEARSPNDFEGAFKAATRERAGALTVLASLLTLTYRKPIVNLAAKNRLPATYPDSQFVEAGGIMSYGTDVADLWRRAATYVDKILKGAKPGDLPVEQPTKFELVINLKTAKQIGLTIPPNVLARADKVIK